MRFADAVAAGLLVTSVPHAAVGQRSGNIWIVQGQATATTAAEPFVGGGLGGGVRTSGRVGAYASANIGAMDGSVALRGEVTLVFHLHPRRNEGLALYGGGGVAIQRAGARADQYIVVLAGVEAAPGSTRGWFAEIGVGGGLRAAAGYRLRWRSAG